jgi:hypothetical protein
VSYDNSFSGIKTNIFNFKGGVPNPPALDTITVEEKPNKPREQQAKMNLTQEIHLINRVQTTLESSQFNKTIKFENYKEQSPKDTPTEPAQYSTLN